jgi:hypothetical protein
MLRPLTSEESSAADYLMTTVSAMLRSAMRSIDSRIAAFEADATDPAGIDPQVVAAMLAGVIKRTLDNPRGLWSRSESSGPYSESETYPGVRGGDGAGEALGLTITASDLAKLNPSRAFAQGGTIRTPQTRWCFE